jgi:hypothetical protein
MKEMDAMIAKMTYGTKKKEAAAALKMSKAEVKKGQHGKLHETYD